MARTSPKPALRPFLPADVPILAAIYQESILELTGEDYSEAQQAAWAAAAEDEAAFGARLSGGLTLLATIAGSPVGFASLKGPDVLDLLYVHPSATGQGAGTLLCDALEKLAAARGAARLTVDASDNALPFFEARGYRAERRNTVPVEDEWLATTTMRKTLVSVGERQA
ncbi:MAG TPA: GNAT family N-acetyltransferase [Beijerinckiaceae bacterium]|jgi:putative acetyltransferase